MPVMFDSHCRAQFWQQIP